MDKILSARVDESVVMRIGMLAERLHTTKKAVIEKAISLYAEKIESEQEIDILGQTSGVWKRDELAEKTVKRGRKAFSHAMDRHHR